MFDIPLLINTYGLIGIGMIVFLESSIFPILPGDSLLFTAGFLASQNILPIIPLFFTVFTAAVLGDSTGYAIGRRYGNTIFCRPKSFFLKPDHIDKTRLFFQKHGPKSVILARFIPIVRTFIPVFAGVGSMKYRTFLMYNIIGGFLWSFSLILGGYYLSRVIPNSEKHIHVIVIGIIVISFLPAIVTLVREKYKARKLS